jgi:hypothetical protein
MTSVILPLKSPCQVLFSKAGSHMIGKGAHLGRMHTIDGGFGA